MAAPAASSPTPVTPVVLHYHVEATPRGSPWPRALALAGSLPLLAVPFVGFTSGISPLDVMTDIGRMMLDRDQDMDIFLALLATPFFVGIPIFSWHARLLVGVGAPRERLIVHALAAASAGMTAGFFATAIYHALIEPPGAIVYDFGVDLGVTGGCAAAAVAGSVLAWRRRGTAQRPDVPPTVALLVAYLANAVLCLYLFGDSTDAGWWLTLAGSGALAVELAVLTATARRSARSAGIPPG